VTDDVFRVAFVAFDSCDIVKFPGSLLTTLTCSNCDCFHIDSIGPFLPLDDIPFIVYANNLGLIRYHIFLDISVIETGKLNGILDPCRPNRLSVGLRRTGINNQVFHLNPRFISNSSEELALPSIEGGSAKSHFITIIRSDAIAGVATDRALGDYDWTVRQCNWYRGLNEPPLHCPQEAILRRCLLTARLQPGHSATHFPDGATTERSQQREPLQPSSFALAFHTLSCP
jgi:hypothetical protein